MTKDMQAKAGKFRMHFIALSVAYSLVFFLPLGIDQDDASSLFQGEASSRQERIAVDLMAG